VTTVIGFPFGNTSAYIKRCEAERALYDGATELDMVINFGQFLDGNYKAVEHELSVMRLLSPGYVLKAILETCYYPTIRQIRHACQLCADLGVDFVKTSTGFGPQGADPRVVEYMVACVQGTQTQVKASGGIRTYEQALTYLDLGCTRIGSSTFLEPL
jgi:deoxyribose-phosphate aldolase